MTTTAGQNRRTPSPDRPGGRPTGHTGPSGRSNGQTGAAFRPLRRKRWSGPLRVTDWFCGAGGATQGCHAIEGVETIMAANHNQQAIDTHSYNFPNVEHFRGDIKDLDVARHPYAEIFWASPECTNWSVAKGKKVDYDGSQQPGLFGDPEIQEDIVRSRALMEDVVRYLRGMHLRQKPVLAGVVENVVDIRKWEHWHRWRSEIEALGYKTRLVALNSMHAQSKLTPRAPQSRDRLYLVYWHVSLGRDPDWDRWLRPKAHCPSCDRDIDAIQTWKKPGADMGRYRQQYVYRCPAVACRGQIVEPYFVPASAAIDWSIPGTRIGDKPLREFYADKEKTLSLGFHPLAPKTLARIVAGIAKYVTPTLVPSGGTWSETAQPLNVPMRARTTRENEGVFVPPLVVPVEGRDGKQAASLNEHLRTLTTRAETAVVFPPFVAELRGGGSDHRPVSESLATITASGNHHGLVTPSDQMAAWAAVYAYDSGNLHNPHRAPLPTQTTLQGDSILSGIGLPNVMDCYFRMLDPDEIHRGMAFTADYVILGNRRERVKQLGNAVTPPAAEVLISALVECITGEWVQAA